MSPADWSRDTFHILPNRKTLGILIYLETLLITLLVRCRLDVLKCDIKYFVYKSESDEVMVYKEVDYQKISFFRILDSL